MLSAIDKDVGLPSPEPVGASVGHVDVNNGNVDDADVDLGSKGLEAVPAVARWRLRAALQGQGAQCEVPGARKTGGDGRQ
ncbi:hypothetical protein FQN49_008579 [Arthroderma sp. PD_2]|nr:hypothetical protein FQN49_008579 [Arthroderma sp. PD_2]